MKTINHKLLYTILDLHCHKRASRVATKILLSEQEHETHIAGHSLSRKKEETTPFVLY